MEHKKSEILMIEGESARPGTYTGTDGRQTELTPEFLKQVFNSYDSTQPLYLSHDNREPMGVITSLSYSDETDTIFWKGIGFDKDKCERANTEGFDHFSPEFDVKSNISDGNKDKPLYGILTGGALTRQPAISTNAVSKSWVAFSAPPEQEGTATVAETSISQEIVPEPTTPIEMVVPPVVNTPVQESIQKPIPEQIKNTIELPKEISKPKWVKLDNGGYILMDENTQITNNEKKPENTSTAKINPEEVAQIELARKTLEEKQRNDEEQIKSLTTELEQLRASNKIESDSASKYKTQYESVMSGEIAGMENELRKFGFENPEEYMKELDIETRIKVLDSARKQFIRSKDLISPPDIEINSDASQSSIDEELSSLNIPEEYKKYVKH